jgi:carbamoyl-phosphate synthase large subunit
MAEQPTRILVTGAGGPSGVAFLQSIAAERALVWMADIDPYAPGLYLVPPERRVLVGRGDDPDFADGILDLCRREQIDLVVPTVDSELLPLAERREEFAAAGTRFLLAPLEALRTCVDKWALMQRCQGQVRIPRSALFDDRFDLEEWGFPFLVKPRRGSGSRGIVVVRGDRDLLGLERSPDLLVQEYLPGVEYSLDVLATEAGEVRAVVPRARLKIDSGIAITGRTVRDETLMTTGREAAEAVGITGVANVQVKEDEDGEAALIEINPRFPGTMPLTVAAGVNMPAIALREALGEPMPPGPIPFEELAMVRYFDQRFFPVAELEQLEASLLPAGKSA